MVGKRYAEVLLSSAEVVEILLNWKKTKKF
jgi:hypothetical protein